MQREYLVVSFFEIILPLVGLRLCEHTGFHHGLGYGRVFGVVLDLCAHELEHLIEQSTITRELGGQHNLQVGLFATDAVLDHLLVAVRVWCRGIHGIRQQHRNLNVLAFALLQQVSNGDQEIDARRLDSQWVEVEAPDRCREHVYSAARVPAGGKCCTTLLLDGFKQKRS
ncbi:hypothetical protein D3C78_854670 [compost metagenome]